MFSPSQSFAVWKNRFKISLFPFPLLPQTPDICDIDPHFCPASHPTLFLLRKISRLLRFSVWNTSQGADSLNNTTEGEKKNKFPLQSPSWRARWLFWRIHDLICLQIPKVFGSLEMLIPLPDQEWLLINLGLNLKGFSSPFSFPFFQILPFFHCHAGKSNSCAVKLQTVSMEMINMFINPQ